jgi:LytR cell envelope-related transcriptional attenuator
MPSYPHDRFDDVPADLQRVGAHRATGRRGRVWLVFGWALAATLALVAAGVIALTIIGQDIAFEGGGVLPAAGSATPTPTVDATPEPVVDATILVTVLNGTNTSGLAAQVGERLTEDGWNVGSRANASTRDVATTTVYYWDPANEAAALGAARSLGSAKVTRSDNFAPEEGEDPAGVARLTVVVGADYAP